MGPGAARGLALAGVVALLAGCAVGPDYVRPAAPTASAFRHAPDAGSPVAPPDADWWRGFNDPVLDRLEAAALADNLDLAQAEARIVQSRAAAQAAGAALLPQGLVTAKAARARQSLNGSSGGSLSLPGVRRTDNLFDLNAGVSWELDLFGGLRRGRQAAQAEAEAAVASGAATRVSLAGDIADAYIQVRAFQARIALAERQITLDRQLLDLVRDRFDSGVAARREVDQASASLALALATLPPLRAGLEAQMNRVAVLCGRPPEAPRADLETPQPIPLPPSLEGAGAPGDLLRRRPDLIAAERAVAAANARIGQAIAGYYPKVSLAALAGFESTVPRTFLGPASTLAQAGGVLTWRMFDFGRVDAEVASARGQTAQALAAYRLAVLRACEEVEDALTARAERDAQVRDLTGGVADLTRQRAAANDAYAAGTVSLIEVIDADRQLLQAGDQLAQAQADSARAAVAGFRALGGGWRG